MSTRSVPLIDRPAPANLESERALLSAILVDPSVLNEVSLIVSGSDFFEPTNGQLFDAFVTLFDARKPIGDVKVLAAELRRLGVLGAENNSPWTILRLKEIAAEGLPQHAGFYADDVRRYSLLRRECDLAADIISRATEHQANPSAIADWADGMLAGLHERVSSLVRSIGDIAIESVAALRKPKLRGEIWCGIQSIDQVIGQLGRGEMNVLAARPGCGKTAFATQVAMHNARRGRRVLIVSLEMTAAELTNRVICSMARIDQRYVRGNHLSESQHEALERHAIELKNCSVDIIDPPRANMREIRAMARLQQRSRGLDLLVIDYLGLIRPAPEDTRREKHEQVGNVSRDCKQLAKELGVPLLCLHQLNRESERSNGPPKLSHLAQSGAIEQDADMVFFLHRLDAGKTAFMVAKNRHGVTGNVPLSWNGPRTSFSDWPSHRDLPE